jgi:hypothetical protein
MVQRQDFYGVVAAHGDNAPAFKLLFDQDFTHVRSF